MKVSLCKIMKDSDLQPRFKLDYSHVCDLKDLYLEGASLPPIDIFDIGGTLFLVDGFHRVKAAELAGLEELETTITKGTKEEAMFACLKANSCHGLKLNSVDKSTYIRKLLTLKECKSISCRELSKLTGVSHQHINNIKRKMEDPNYIPKTGGNYWKEKFLKLEAEFKEFKSSFVDSSDTPTETPSQEPPVALKTSEQTTPIAEPANDLVTVKDAANSLDISIKSIEDAISMGMIKCVNDFYVDINQIKQWRSN